MPVTAGLIMAGGSLLGGGISALGSFFGSQQQTNALQQALAQQRQMFDVAKGGLQPFISAGQGALPTLTNLLTPGPSQTQTLSQLPGFQFAQQWGQRAVENLGTTTGLGGNTLTAGANFATGLAQQNFGNLAGLLQNYANMGLGGAGQLAGAAGTFGQTMGNTLAGIGQAQAQGTLGMTNAISGGVQSAAYAPLLARLFGGGGMGGMQNAGALLAPGVYSGQYLSGLNPQVSGSTMGIQGVGPVVFNPGGYPA